MSTEIRRDKVIGNFKRPRAERLAEKMRDDHDDRDGNSRAHLDCIRKLPCCIPGCAKMPGGQAHHLKSTGLRGMGMRSPDQFTVSMCEDHHLNGVESAGSKNELSWFSKRGIEALELAAALWAATGDVPKMTRIVIEHKRARNREREIS